MASTGWITCNYLKKDISTAFMFQVRQRNENVARTQMISVVELFFHSLLAVQDDNFPLWNQFSAFLQRGWSCDKKSEGRSFWIKRAPCQDDVEIQFNLSNDFSFCTFAFLLRRQM